MVEVPRKVVSALLGVSVCVENDREEEVCLYANAGGDGRVYIKVTVDGEKVAYARFDPNDIFALLAPAVLAKTVRGRDIKKLWNALKEREEEDEEGEEERGEGGERRTRRKKAAKREKKTRRGEEEWAGDEEEEELPFE